MRDRRARAAGEPLVMASWCRAAMVFMKSVLAWEASVPQSNRWTFAGTADSNGFPVGLTEDVELIEGVPGVVGVPGVDGDDANPVPARALSDAIRRIVGRGRMMY